MASPRNAWPLILLLPLTYIILYSKIRLSPFPSLGKAEYNGPLIRVDKNDDDDDDHYDYRDEEGIGRKGIKEEQESPINFTVIITGLSTRFTFLDDLGNYSGVPLIIITLQHDPTKSSDAEAFSGTMSNKPVKPKYGFPDGSEVESSAIVEHYKSRGAGRVVVEFVSKEDIDRYGSLSTITSSPISSSLYPTPDPVRLLRNLRMLTLRSFAYASYLSRSPDPPDEYKDRILYKREDNYWLDGGEMAVVGIADYCPRIPTTSEITKSPYYCYLVDVHCPQTSSGQIFKAPSDKIYLLSPLSASLLFTLPTLTTLSQHWTLGGNTEMYISSLTSKLPPHTLDFRRADVRYVNGMEGACVNRGYMKCNSGWDEKIIKPCPLQ